MMKQNPEAITFLANYFRTQSMKMWQKSIEESKPKPIFVEDKPKPIPVEDKPKPIPVEDDTKINSENQELDVFLEISTTKKASPVKKGNNSKAKTVVDDKPVTATESKAKSTKQVTGLASVTKQLEGVSIDVSDEDKTKINKQFMALFKP